MGFVRQLRYQIARHKKVVAILLACVVVAAVGIPLTVTQPWADDPCADGLTEYAGECVGVAGATVESPAFEPGADGPQEGVAALVRSVAQENERVRRQWAEPGDEEHREPYVRVALMLPYNSTASSAMNAEVIRHSLAGVHAAQVQANDEWGGVNFQLLLVNIAKDLSYGDDAVAELTAMTGGAQPTENDAPLVGAIGLPNSEQDTQDAAEALATAEIPAVSGVVSSPDIKADTLFKVAPSNLGSVRALRAHLEDNPGEGEGYLVWDSRDEDNYVTNTRELMEVEFGTDYGLENRNSSFVGVMGQYEGAPRRFSPAAEGICKLGADTVFYAGRDADLPHLITQLAREPECDDHEGPIRVLRVATGLPSGLTTKQVREDMEEANVVTLSAATADVPSWRAGEGASERFRAFVKSIGSLKNGAGLSGGDLDDGYAVAHYDALRVLAEAVDTVLEDLHPQDAGARPQDADPSKRRMPSIEDVYNTITNMKVVPDPKDPCHNCVRGASGMFGYDEGKDNWPVCKPVPIIEYPPQGSTGRTPVYRNFQAEDGSCPA